MECKCLRCNYKWVARVRKPKECPKCKAYDWDKPKGK